MKTDIGVIAPHDLALDRELWRWVPESVSLMATRTAPSRRAATVEMITEISGLSSVTDAVERITPIRPSAVAYACTSCSFIRGVDGEQTIVTAMRNAGAPEAITASGALVQALHHVDAEKVVAVSPYAGKLATLFEQFLTASGLQLISSAHLGLLEEIRSVPAATTLDLIIQADHPDADAVCVACTNLPTYDVIADAEQALGKPVVTANQALMWAALQPGGHRSPAHHQHLIARS